MAATKGRLVIPKRHLALLRLAEQIYKKHLNDGDGSLLLKIEGLDWNTEGPNIARALKEHLDAEEFKGKMELAYSQRDILMDSIIKAVKKSGTGLKGMMPDNPKRLGQWGFTVDDTRQVKRKKTE